MVSTLSTCGCLSGAPKSCSLLVVITSTLFFFFFKWIFSFVLSFLWDNCNKCTPMPQTYNAIGDPKRVWHWHYFDSHVLGLPLAPTSRGPQACSCGNYNLKLLGWRDGCALSCFNSHYFLTDYVLISYNAAILIVWAGSCLFLYPTITEAVVFPCVTRFSPWSIGCLTRLCVIGLAPPQESTTSWR